VDRLEIFEMGVGFQVDMMALFSLGNTASTLVIIRSQTAPKKNKQSVTHTFRQISTVKTLVKKKSKYFRI